MKVINLFGGPGCGKSTTAAGLFAWLKLQHKRAELVGEAAKELIYQKRPIYQTLCIGMQHAKLKDLEATGCEYAISDSALLLQAAYCESDTLKTLCKELDAEFDNYYIYLLRDSKPYDTFGRWQKTIEEAMEWDRRIAKTCEKYHLIAGSLDEIIKDAPNWLK